MKISPKSRIGRIIIASLIALLFALMGAYAHALWSSRGLSLTRSLNALFGLQIDHHWAVNALRPRRQVEEKKPRSPPKSLALHCLPKREIERFRANVTIVESLFLNCRAELIKSLGVGFRALTDDDLKIVFATILAHELAPYGNSSVVDFDRLLSEPQLDCDNYAALAGHISALMGVLSERSVKFYVVGFDGGAVGNHAQIFYVRDGVNLFL